MNNLPDPVEVFPRYFFPVFHRGNNNRFGIELVVVIEMFVARFLHINGLPFKVSFFDSISESASTSDLAKFSSFKAGRTTCVTVEIIYDQHTIFFSWICLAL